MNNYKATAGCIGLKKKDCSDLVNDIIEEIILGLNKNKIVKIHNFGTIRLKRKESRIRRNPKTKEDLMIDSDLLGVEFIVIDKGFAVLGNIYPGEHQILFTYGIKYDEREYIYIRNLQFDLNNLRIITENNLNIELPDFTYDQNDTFVNEIKYNLIEMNNFKQKEKIKIIFSDLPQATIFDKSKNYIQNFDRGWGMFVLFFIILIILLPILLGNKRRIKS